MAAQRVPTFCRTLEAPTPPVPYRLMSMPETALAMSSPSGTEPTRYPARKAKDAPSATYMLRTWSAPTRDPSRNEFPL
jgi:hypothetical protein